MNTILYIGLGVFLFGFILFLISAIRIGQINRHLHRQKQLGESMKNADKTNERKYNDTY